jgi:hypothetical protein
MFLPNYTFERCHYDKRIKGGAREEMFSQIGINTAPVVSKYPLIYVKDDDIIINSHCNLPANRNMPDFPETVLRHYKFLAGDKKKYLQRINKGNFENDSEEYKAYLQLEEGMEYQKVVSKMIKYNDFESSAAIDIMR